MMELHTRKEEWMTMAAILVKRTSNQTGRTTMLVEVTIGMTITMAAMATTTLSAVVSKQLAAVVEAATIGATMLKLAASITAKTSEETKTRQLAAVAAAEAGATTRIHQLKTTTLAGCDEEAAMTNSFAETKCIKYNKSKMKLTTYFYLFLHISAVLQLFL